MKCEKQCVILQPQTVFIIYVKTVIWKWGNPACQKKENILYKNENEKVSIVGIPGDWYYCQSPK